MLTVLLADDHAIVRDGLRSLLEAHGDIRVVGTASNGNEAVTKAERLRPQVAVLDISMPALNGIDAAKQIAEKSPGTRVIILSIHSTSEHIYHALQAGVRGYLLKESAGLEVVTAVREVALGKLYLSAKVSDSLALRDVLEREETETRSPLARLSPREREILQLVVEGRSSSEIGKSLYLSPKTVDTYRSRLMGKLDISDLPSLVKFAIQHGLTPLG